jgi:hypothetical protein
MVEEALSILRTADDESHLVWALQLRGLVLGAEGDYVAADQAMQDGVRRTKALRKCLKTQARIK